MSTRTRRAMTPRRTLGRSWTDLALLGAIAVPVAWSAILAKSMTHAPALLDLSSAAHATSPTPDAPPPAAVPVSADTPDRVVLSAATPAPPETNAENAHGGVLRWFNGRPVRPAKRVLMRVTAYSPDARSCGRFADGKTATLHSVWTNNMQLVAADPTVLPYGSMVTVEGYANDAIVPVLDCGGAIKGNRLDLLMPTHRQARQWGVEDMVVTVWEYADGKPACNPRKLR